MTARNTTATTASYQVHAYVNQRGKLYLIVANPDRLRYKIMVADQKDRTLYEEFTNHEQYRRKLDLSPLSYDAYKVIVQIDNQPIIYTVKRQDNRFAYGIQLSSVTRKAGSHAQSRDTLALIKPAVIDL